MVTTKYNEFIYAARPRKKFDLRRKLRKMLPERILRLGPGTYLGGDYGPPLWVARIV